MFNITIDNTDVKIPVDTIGVDMGQTLSKLAYSKDGKLTLSYFLTQSKLSTLKKVLDSEIENYDKINFTGGKSYKLYQEYSNEIEAKLINEFEANAKGVEVIHLVEKRKNLPASLIVTMGTGTSIVLKKDEVKHIGGTAMGGGFFMGLTKILFNIGDYDKALKLAKKGNRYNVDLKVSDIYDPEDHRVDLLFREFTAASLGKINMNFDIDEMNKEDFLNSIISMMGENIATVACLMAEREDISDIVFCGGFIKENKILKRIISPLCIFNKKRAIFLKNSEFCASIGALIL
jgi:type II pantothenate kinase